MYRCFKNGKFTTTMKFHKQTDADVTVTTADGKKYRLIKHLDIPLQRYIAAKPYLIQDELKITFYSLMLLLDNIEALTKNEKVNLPELQQGVQRQVSILKEKINMATDIVTIKLSLAALCWAFEGEDMQTLDPVVMAKKLEVMQANKAALSFFLTSPMPFDTSKLTVTTDTLMFLAQMERITGALHNANQSLQTL